MKKILILLILFPLFTFFAISQNNNSENPAVKFLLKEKVKFSPEDYIYYKKTGKMPQKFNKTINDKERKENLQSVNNIVVSDDNMSESEIHAAINPTDSNNIIISPIRLGDGSSGFTDMITCPVYYTTDFGQSWQKSSFKNSPKDQSYIAAGGGDPMFTFDKNGVAYLSWIYLSYKFQGMQVDSIVNTMHWAYSDDGGISWQREDNEYVAVTGIDPNNGEDLEEFFDKQWMAADYSNSEYSNNIYLTLTHMKSDGIDIELYTKESGAIEFNKDPVVVHKNQYFMTQFSNIDVDNEGNIHVIFYGTEDNESNTLFHTISTDGGKTFRKEKKISDFVLDGSSMLPGNSGDRYPGINPDRLYPCPQFAIDKSNADSDGTLYVTWTAVGIDENEGNSLDIYLSKSIDKGETWSTPRVVHDDAKGHRISQFYSNISVNPKGVVVLSWYDRRDDQLDRETNYYMTFSFDNGDTFIEDFPVTDVSTNFETVGLTNGNFGVGEYNMLLSTKGYAIPVWSDGRNNNGDMNVYTAFIPISENTTSVERLTSINSGIKEFSITPNPISDNANIRLWLNESGNVRFSIISIDGTTNKILLKDNLTQGEHVIEFNSSELPQGSYLLVLQFDDVFEVRKVVINK